MRLQMIWPGLALAGILFLAGTPASRAQEPRRGLDWNLVAGVNLGATTPVPVPGALNITGYKPRFNPKIGAEATWYFTENWGLGTGLTLDWKSMRVRTRVDEVHLAIDVPNAGTLTGYVTGRNQTRVKTLYLTQPIYGTYRFDNPRWKVRAGVFLAESLHRKFNGSVSDVVIHVQSPIEQERHVPYATLDYSEDARKFDMGVLAGGEFRMNDQIGFFADFTWGVIPYFYKRVPIRFSMYNLYFSLGATLRL